LLGAKRPRAAGERAQRPRECRAGANAAQTDVTAKRRTAGERGPGAVLREAASIRRRASEIRVGQGFFNFTDLARPAAAD
jgi:hypothetical protein